MSFDDLVFQSFAVFIQRPLLAFVPAAVFGAAYAWAQRIIVLSAALAWALYATLETLNKAGITCSGECNIRIDLLIIYPVLWIASIAGVIALCFGRRRAAA